MKKARMNISHSRFILFKLKIFGEIITTFFFEDQLGTWRKVDQPKHFAPPPPQKQILPP